MNPAMPERTPGSVLRVVAVVGVIAVLVSQTAEAVPPDPHQGWGIIVLVIAAIAIAALLTTRLGRGRQAILASPDLLVPIGILVIVEAGIGWLTLIPGLGAMVSVSIPVKLLGFDLTVSAVVVLTLLVRVYFASWVTLLILARLRGEPVDLVRTFREAGRWFGRTLVVCLIGWAVIFAALVPLLPAVALGRPGFLLFFVVGSVVTLVWNLATVLVLPVALDQSLFLGEAIKRGIRTSWGTKGRWWGILVVQLLLLGVLTFVSVSYGLFDETRHTSYSFNAMWVGGYPDDCKWHDKVVGAFGSEPIRLIDTLLGMLFLVLAIATRVEMLDRIGFGAPDPIDLAEPTGEQVPPFEGATDGEAWSQSG